ncbi:MAG TPA: hypothetical protein H9727_06575 [Candidatus Borkfalkia avistercoris]|uniref:Zinc ribbon domain-containing protein n=1 Tax=Candidatus Borkfalkia avistercoris TaxID=2838504 RepID=A0A9D2CZV5_9FIRM|nr:hypothetical protein [Candidatus Borkfalkia avistercoris]
MKICKNCGQQTDDSKIRCPHCGFLFEEDMDDVLRDMKSTLKNYKQQAAAEAAAAQPRPAQQSQAAAQDQPAQQPETRERFELLSEVAQLKGEVRVLQNEIERLHDAQRQNPQAAPVSVVYAQQPAGAVAAGTMPAAGVYARQPVQGDGAVAGGKAVKKRSANRVVVSVFCTLLLALSIGMFFMVWVDQWLDDFGGTMKGFQGLLYLFDKNSADVQGFVGVLATIDAHNYAGGAAISGFIQNVCHYVVQWGVVVYAACLILSLPILFSLGGKIKFRAWHRFWAWISFLVALVLFGVFCWSFGFSALTVWFLLGAGANFVRAIFLCFFKKDKFAEGGLQ